jgi:hypothetical protein
MRGGNRKSNLHDASLKLPEGVTQTQSFRYQLLALIPQKEFDDYVVDQRKEGREILKGAKFGPGGGGAKFRRFL